MDKHFEKQTNVVLGKNKQTNKCSEKKQNAVLRNRASKNKWRNIKKKNGMQFGEK